MLSLGWTRVKPAGSGTQVTHAPGTRLHTFSSTPQFLIHGLGGSGKVGMWLGPPKPRKLPAGSCSQSYWQTGLRTSSGI